MKIIWYRLTALLLACMLCGMMTAQADSVFGSPPFERAYDMVWQTLDSLPDVDEAREGAYSNRLSIILMTNSTGFPASVTVCYPYEGGAHNYAVWTELFDEEVKATLNDLLENWDYLERSLPEGRTMTIKYIDDYYAYMYSNGEEGCTWLASASEVELFLASEASRCDYCGGDGEAFMHCLACKAEGTQPCSICSGQGKTRCSACQGTGLRRCAACMGQGCTLCYKGKVECTTCKGYGSADCFSCSGTGGIPCDECSGSGTMTFPCRQCNGDGVIG